tara:strand:- start:1026 stop:2141 length:1116 start_codon:yes stop_codon:yes gene_type:complete
MKILLPFLDPYGRRITDSQVSGGTERFCKLINNNFDVEVLQYEFETEHDYYKKTGADKVAIRREITKKMQQEILNKAEECNADIIINNFAWSAFCGSIVSNSHIPIMNIEHCFYPFLSINNRFENLHKKGHSLFLVSDFQREWYDNKIKKYTKSKFLPFGIIRPSYCTKPDILDSEYDCGTIGRCDVGKSPFKLKHMTKHTDLKTLVITAMSSSTVRFKKTNAKMDGHTRYYEKNKNWDNTVWDLKHDDVIKNISKCNTFFSTWNRETWGITAMEALSCGIPIILNSYRNGNHASEIIPASPSHYKKIPTNDKDALVSAIKSFENVDRKEIQEMTYEKHNQDAWKQHIKNAIDKTIETFKSHQNNLNTFIA